jgi:uncharacterized protein YfaS (alpha-2-macroglobulin family)
MIRKSFYSILFTLHYFLLSVTKSINHVKATQARQSGIERTCYRTHDTRFSSANFINKTCGISIFLHHLNQNQYICIVNAMFTLYQISNKIYMKQLIFSILILFAFAKTAMAQDIKFNTGNYPKEWKEIQDLEDKGLPKSALEKVVALYARAKADANPSQIIKTLLYQSRYKYMEDKDGQANGIEAFRLETEKETFPVKPIMQSILAQMYSNYVLQNQWQFRNRTTTQDFKQEDIRTWDITKLYGEAARLHKESLKDEQLKKVLISNFDDITSDGDDRLRPTLYDFLAHRAIDFFMDEKSYLAKPAYRFELDTEGSFLDAENFVKEKFASRDTSSDKLWAIKLMQDVLRFHLKDATPDALIDVDLKRLMFVHSNSVVDTKDDLYVKALGFLKEKHKNHPAYVEVSLRMAEYFRDKGQNYKPNPNNVGRGDYNRALSIAKDAVAKFPKAYGSNGCRQLIASITEGSLGVQVEQVNVPNKAILAKVEYRNLSTMYFKLIKITDKLNKKSFTNEEEKLDYYNSLKAVRQWTAAVPDEGLHNQTSTEIAIEKLPLGQYYLLSSDNEKFSLKNTGNVSYQKFHVSNIAYAKHTDDESEQEFLVMDRLTGAPLKGVKALFFSETYNPKNNGYDYILQGNALTDAKGFVKPKFKGNGYYKVKFVFGKDSLDVDDGFSMYERNNNPQTSSVTHFFTDRAIYRPSQTVFFKAVLLAYDVNRKPTIAVNKPVKITFFDRNGQKVSELSLVSNAYGTVTGSFLTPASGLLGQMHLTSDFGNSTQYFRVEEYKRPKFETKISPLEGNFTLNQDIKVKGNAKAYAGSYVDGAKVVYRVTREVRFPYWRDWYWNPWGNIAPQEIAHGEVLTNEKGEFTVPFKALPNKAIPAKDKPVFVYNIAVDVTDITGETHSTTSSVTIGYTSLTLNSDVPQLVNRRNVKSLKINSNNLNDQPIAAKVDVKLELLTSPRRPYISRYWSAPDSQSLTKEEFNRLFPYYAYKNEDKIENWLVKKKVYDETFQTVAPLSKEGNLLQIPNFKDFMPGAYRMTLTAKDASGETIQSVEHFTIYDPTDKLVPTNNTLFTVFEKETFEVGENAEFALGTAEENLNVLFEIERDGKVETQNWMPITALQQLLFVIEEADRGNIFYHLTYVKNNRFIHLTKTLNVPYSNKELNVEYQTFRDKLAPGQEEEWRLKISGKNKDKVAAELLMAMYDASLDAFAPHGWYMNLYPSRYSRKAFNARSFGDVNSNPFYRENTEGGIEGDGEKKYRNMYLFGFEAFASYGGGMMYDAVQTRSRAGGVPMPAPMATQAKMEEVVTTSVSGEAKAKMVSPESDKGLFVQSGKKVNGNAAVEYKDGEIAQKENAPVQVRTNLNETVFFLPNLMTDNDGNVIVKFKMGEALTRWKLLGMAHTKDLKVGLTEKTIVTQKDLMVFPNAPRFFREGDKIEFTAKVSNLTNATMKGNGILQLFDALTSQPIDVVLDNKNFDVPFEAKGGESALLTWKLTIPVGKVQAVTYRVIARSGNYSDGEESTLPVLTNRMLVTETLPLSIRGGVTKKFEFKALKDAKSATLQNHKLTLEFTQNPAWYAVQALPYLMEYPYECTEQIFSRYYANTLASHVANSNPKIKAVFDRWKNTDVSALQSNLSKNQELKTALLEETPWVLAAQNEELRKKNIGLLFDLNKMANEQAVAMKKIQERQLENGGFAWFPGGRDDWYITQYMTEGFGHLNKLGVTDFSKDAQTKVFVSKSLAYCREKAKKEYAELQERIQKGKAKADDDNLGSMMIHFFYSQSLNAFDPLSKTEPMYAYYVGQMEKYWVKHSTYEQALIGLFFLNQNEKRNVVDAISKSLKERAINSEELGMYWKNDYGYRWHELPIETHSTLIEFFTALKDEKVVEDCKIWLLKNKQTSDWKTTKATANAVYALLLSGDNWLVDEGDVSVSLGGNSFDMVNAQKEAGTGYFKIAYKPEDIKPQMGDVSIKNPNKVVAWGAMYYQYFENLDKIKTFKETPLKMVKQLFKETNSDKGKVMSPILDKTALKPGDKIKVRIELRVDRDMEYVHMKDMRAAGFEPTNVLSSYKWQGGLGYYESTRDAATNFFISYLPKGTYVFEYPLVVNHKGDFSNGVTTIQCMYAPEFTSHSEGIRVRVGE